MWWRGRFFFTSNAKHVAHGLWELWLFVLISCMILLVLVHRIERFLCLMLVRQIMLFAFNHDLADDLLTHGLYWGQPCLRQYFAFAPVNFDQFAHVSRVNIDGLPRQLYSLDGASHSTVVCEEEVPDERIYRAVIDVHSQVFLQALAWEDGHRLLLLWISLIHAICIDFFEKVLFIGDKAGWENANLAIVW